MISLSRRALSGGAAAVLVAGTLVTRSDEDEPAVGEFGREGYVHVADGAEDHDLVQR